MSNTIYFVLAVLLALPHLAFAHKVNLFCYIEDDTVYGEGFFSQGNPVKESIVEVYEAESNALVATTKTNDTGMFSAPLHGAENIRVVLDAGMGHRTEYLLTQSRAAEEQFAAATVEESMQVPLDYRKIEEIIQKEIRPLRDDIRRLEKQQSGPDVAAIVGGLGWIVGIFSLLYLLRKKNAS